MVLVRPLVKRLKIGKICGFPHNLQFLTRQTLFGAP
jgi:hypothetical protein